VIAGATERRGEFGVLSHRVAVAADIHDEAAVDKPVDERTGPRKT
jgi:hypothetical protein